MGNTTPGLALRYGYDGDVITHATVANLADDIAAQLTAADTARAAALRRPVFYGRRALGTQNLPVSTTVIVQMDQEIFDTHGMINLGTDNTKISCVAGSGAGIYELTMMARCTTTSWTKGEWAILKNGVVVVQQTVLAPSSNNHAAPLQVALGVGDYAQVSLYHEGGGTTTLNYIEIRGRKVSA